MQSNIMKKVKLLITVVIIVGFLWFLVISPMITFHSNEKKLEEAAKRYFELNSNQLPTGQRVKTVTLATLYHKSFIKGDIYIPHTTKTCSIENSWVKVKKENNDYKYYTYLECGILSSTIDHKGPEITLNGNNSVTVGLGEEFTDSGVKNVVDNVDGKLNIKDVTIKGKVDTSKVGTYEIKYIAFDSLSNKTEVIREVKVVQKLNSTIKKSLKDNSNFKGDPKNNYIRLSNQLFRVYGIDGNNNVVIVANEDISNVNYSKLDKWLDYYYNNLNKTTQNMIVKSKYCNETLDDSNNNTTKCKSFTDDKKIYIPSVVEVNRAQKDSSNFMKPVTISWVANPKKGGKEAYVTRDVFYYDEYGKSFISYNKNENYGVRPMMTIKGNSLISGGKGTEDDPYVFGDVKKAKGGTAVNKRYTGEYIELDGDIYRIIKTEKDGTIKVIAISTVGSISENVLFGADLDGNKYDPKDKNSVAYFINNKISKYVDTSYFVNHTINVPVYKEKIIYGEEVSNKEYKAVLSAPDMYEMFSTFSHDAPCDSYWLKNTSNKKDIIAAIYPAGVPINEKITTPEKFGIRVVGYLKKDTVISSGDGTVTSPYKVK